MLLQPAATESRSQQPGHDDGATAHDVPEQARPVVLDHQHDRTLIDAKVVRRDPPTGRNIRHRKRLVEGWLEPVFPCHSQVHSREVRHRGNDDLRRKRYRRDHDPWGYSAVVWPEWGASSDVIEEIAFDAIDLALRPTRPVASSESPAMLAVADEVERIPGRIFLLHKRGLPAVL